jgi:TP901 family phage tail tape measure protein
MSLPYNTVPGSSLAGNNAEKIDFLIGVTNMAWPGIAAVQSGFANLTAAGMRTTGALNAEMSKLQGGMMALGGGAALAIGLMTNEAAKFQKEMALAQSLMENVTNTQIAQMNDAAKQLAVTFGELPTEVAAGFQRLGRAGVSDMNDQMVVLTNSIRLAKIEGLGIETSTNILISTIATFGDTYQNAEKYANTLAHAANLTIATVKDLGDSLKYFGSVAREHWSIEETTAAISTLAQKGIVGMLAGTALRSFTNYLIREMPKSQRALNQLGLTFDEFWEHAGGHRTKLKPLEDIVKLMYDASKAQGMTRGDFTKVLAQFGEPRMMQQYLKLFPTDEEMENGTWVFDKFNKKMQEGYDIATRYNTVMQTASAQFDQFKSAMIVLGISVGESILPAFGGLLSLMKSFTNIIAQNHVLTTLLAGALVTLAAAGAIVVAQWSWGLVAATWTTATLALKDAIYQLADILGIESAAVAKNSASWFANIGIRQNLANFLPTGGLAEASTSYPVRDPVGWAMGRADTMSRKKDAGTMIRGEGYHGTASDVNEVYMSSWLAQDLQKTFKSSANVRTPMPYKMWEENAQSILGKGAPTFTTVPEARATFMAPGDYKTPFEGYESGSVKYHSALREKLATKAKTHQRNIMDIENQMSQAEAHGATKEEWGELGKALEGQQREYDRVKNAIADSANVIGTTGIVTANLTWKDQLKNMVTNVKEMYKTPKFGTLGDNIKGKEWVAHPTTGETIQEGQIGLFGPGGRFYDLKNRIAEQQLYEKDIIAEQGDRYPKGATRPKDVGGQFKPGGGRYAAGETVEEAVGGRFAPVGEKIGSKAVTIGSVGAMLAPFIPEAIAGLPLILAGLIALAVPIVALAGFFTHLGSQIDDNTKKVKKLQDQSTDMEKTVDGLQRALDKSHPGAEGYLGTLQQLEKKNRELDKMYDNIAATNREIYNAKAWQPQNWAEFRKQEGPSWFSSIGTSIAGTVNPDKWRSGENVSKLMGMEKGSFGQSWMTGPREQMLSSAYAIEKERQDKIASLTDSHNSQMKQLDDQHKKGRFASEGEYLSRRDKLVDEYNVKRRDMDTKYNRQTAQVVGPENVEATKKLYEMEERLKSARLEMINAIMKLLGVFLQLLTLPLTIFGGNAFKATAQDAKGHTENLNSQIQKMTQEMEAAAKRIEAFADAINSISNPILYMIYLASHFVAFIKGAVSWISNPINWVTKSAPNPFPESFGTWLDKNREGKEHYNPGELKDNVLKRTADWIGSGKAGGDIYAQLADVPNKIKGAGQAILNAPGDLVRKLKGSASEYEAAMFGHKEHYTDEERRKAEEARKQGVTLTELRSKYMKPPVESSVDQMQKKKEGDAAQAQVPPAGKNSPSLAPAMAGAGIPKAAGVQAPGQQKGAAYGLHSPFKVNSGVSGFLGAATELIFPDLDPKKFIEMAKNTAKTLGGAGRGAINFVTGTGAEDLGKRVASFSDPKQLSLLERIKDYTGKDFFKDGTASLRDLKNLSTASFSKMISSLGDISFNTLFNAGSSILGGGGLESMGGFGAKIQEILLGQEKTYTHMGEDIGKIRQGGILGGEGNSITERIFGAKVGGGFAHGPGDTAEFTKKFSELTDEQKRVWSEGAGRDKTLIHDTGADRRIGGWTGEGGRIGPAWRDNFIEQAKKLPDDIKDDIRPFIRGKERDVDTTYMGKTIETHKERFGGLLGQGGLSEQLLGKERSDRMREGAGNFRRDLPGNIRDRVMGRDESTYMGKTIRPGQEGLVTKFDKLLEQTGLKNVGQKFVSKFDKYMDSSGMSEKITDFIGKGGLGKMGEAFGKNAGGLLESGGQAIDKLLGNDPDRPGSLGSKGKSMGGKLGDLLGKGGKSGDSILGNLGKGGKGLGGLGKDLGKGAKGLGGKVAGMAGGLFEEGGMLAGLTGEGGMLAGLAGEGGILAGLGGAEGALAAFGLADIWNPLGWAALAGAGIMGAADLLGFRKHSPFTVWKGQAGTLPGSGPGAGSAYSISFPELDADVFKKKALETGQEFAQQSGGSGLYIENFIIQTKDDPESIKDGLKSVLMEWSRQLGGT